MTSLKTYQAPSMAEALAEVKRELGKDAVILHTRNRRKSGLLGLLGRRPIWEVTASASVNVLPRGHKGQYLPCESQNTDCRDIFGSPEPPFDKLDETLTNKPSQSSDPPGGQLSEIHHMLQALLDGQGGKNKGKMPPILRHFHDELHRQDIAGKIVTDLITKLRMGMTGRQLDDHQTVRGKLAELIAARIPNTAESAGQSNSLRGRIIALVGPTGVGKTTTVAKLAANMKLKESRKVGLITMDTYRIAAVDQLKTYAEILEVPLKTVMTPQEMTQALYAMRSLDVILIDTVGRSQNDQLRLNQLRGFLNAAQADEIHLVVAATSNRQCAEKVVSRFSPLGANRVIVTKLDEVDGCGMVLNIAELGKVPLSYISTGQEVPDDISCADPHDLASRILGGCVNAS